MRASHIRFLAAFLACALPSATHAGISLVVTPPSKAPPATPAENRGPAPFRDAVWIDGRWDWKAGRYTWIAGHWQRAPGGFHRWQKGEWAEQGGHWFFTPGKWF